MNVSPYLLHAIGYSYVRRKLYGLYIIAAAALVICTLLIGLLIHLGGWWWLLITIIFIIVLMILLFILATTLVMRLVKPRLSTEQHGAVESFVDKLERVADTIQTPVPFILVRVVIDLARKSKQSFLRSLITDSRDLLPEAQRLNNLFND